MEGKIFYQIAPGEDAGGKPIFSVLVKRVYTILPDLPVIPSETQRPLVQMDEYYGEGDPQKDSVRLESDMVPFKCATDVVFVGRAYTPGGVPAPFVKTALTVGSHRKELIAIGDRTCEFHAGGNPVFRDPADFTAMEIRYERAYGGTDFASEPALPFAYPRNHIGTGFVVKNLPETVNGLRLPNIEDPQELLTPESLITGDLNLWNRQPLAQGYGWFQKTWYPRCSFLAAMPAFVPVDETMREERLGLVPQRQAALARAFRLPSRDYRFFNGASLGLTVPYLKGDELVTLGNLTPSGFLRFQLPGEIPRVGLDIGMGEKELQPVLHSVTIRSDENELDLVWRAALEYPGVEWLPNLKRLYATVQ